MKTVLKYAAAAALTGALALAAVSPSQARDGRNAAAIGGFAAGALIGAAVANSANRGAYYYDEPGYAYAPGPYAQGPYAYEPGPTYYVAPAPRYYYGGPYSSRKERSCNSSPGAIDHGSCY
jgi:hypothetical protein